MNTPFFQVSFQHLTDEVKIAKQNQYKTTTNKKNHNFELKQYIRPKHNIKSQNE